MKALGSLVIALLCAASTLAQQQYLLQPADTAGKISVNESYQMNRISETRKKSNRILGGMEGYRIEVYQGSDRKQAQETYKLFQELYPNTSANVVFENPYVKVKVGTYRNKIEAQKLYSELKDNEDFEGVKIVYQQKMEFPTLGCDFDEEDTSIKEE